MWRFGRLYKNHRHTGVEKEKGMIFWVRARDWSGTVRRSFFKGNH